jgi:phosphatidate cytidylyltransferase
MDKNLIQRLITGLFFVAILVGCIVWNEWSLLSLFTLVIVLGLWEFYRLAKHVPAKPWQIYGTLAGTVIFLLLFFSCYYSADWLITLAVPLIFLPLFLELYAKSDQPFTNLAYTFLGWIYLVLPFGLWILLLTPTLQNGGEYINPEINSVTSHSSERTTYRWQLLLGFFIILWTSDSLAYVCGRLFGRHKLFERISPKKTWEGFIGGFLFTLLAGWIVGYFFTDMGQLHWIVIAGIISVTGTLGDLTESMFKRSIRVKDSGTILPGHGGILDRFDAALLASPFVTTYIMMLSINHIP